MSTTVHVPSTLADIEAKVDIIDTNVDSILVEVTEIETHIHNVERWCGISANQSGNDWALESSLNPFSVVTQAGDFTATAIKVIGTDDTPFISGKTYFDPHRIDIDSASGAEIYILRFIYGTGADADVEEAAGRYTDTMFFATNAAGPGADGGPLEIRFPRLAVDTKVWCKAKAAGVETVTFFIGIHEYDV